MGNNPELLAKLLRLATAFVFAASAASDPSFPTVHPKILSE
jgi:hypothetical protein